MLLCDFCNNGWHTYCLEPPLEYLPPSGEPWLCPTCSCEEGFVTKQQLVDVVRDKKASRTNAPPRDPSDAIHKLRTAIGDKAAAQQDGLLVQRATTRKNGKESAVWGVDKFRGAKRLLP